MSEDSGFKILITNQSNKERIIRAIIAVVLVIVYFFVSTSASNIISLFGLSIAGVLIFNAISGNCYIYRALGINTCPRPDSND